MRASVLPRRGELTQQFERQPPRKGRLEGRDPQGVRPIYFHPMNLDRPAVFLVHVGLAKM
jgi:hypothetical protein